MRFKDTVLALLQQILVNQEKQMSTAADLATEMTALIASVTAENTVITSAESLITGLNATDASLTTQLAAAIAAGGSSDSAALQAVLTSMQANQASVDAAKTQLAAAVVAGTPAA